MMHTMMNPAFGGASTTGSMFGLTTLWGLHVLSVILFFVGMVLLTTWAIKTLNQKQLKTWGITLVVIGTIVCLLTIGARGAMWGNNFGSFRMMQNGTWNSNDLPSMMDGDISMNGMNMMLQGKTGDSFDAAFIEMMIPHHQGAIDMARAAQASAQHQEIKDMAEDIISAQQSEIDMMKRWQQEWGYTE